jgi:hypothetical protein
MSHIADEVARYALHRGLQIEGVLGAGKDGTVYDTNLDTAVKLHAVAENYLRERDVYLRLLDCDVTRVCGLSVPILRNYDDQLLIIEMTTVAPPYLLDFASAWLDKPPDFPPEVLDEWHERLRESFGDRFTDILGVLEALARDAGVYMLDIHPHNVKFERDVLP